MITKTQHASNSAPSSRTAVDIELLALDFSTCTRCVGTLANIEKAIDKVREVLDVTARDMRIHKILIESEEQARQHNFVTSPTIRINGRDIVFDTLESQCDSCTDLCGCDEGTNCRVWRYQGQEYTEAPVGLIVEALLREISIGAPEVAPDSAHYTGVPRNLQNFFKSKSTKDSVNDTSCCSPEEQDTCCEQSEKETCCGTEINESCGCQ